MNLKVEPVNRTSKQKVKEIYTSSFQKKDRMPFFLMLLLAKLRHTEFLSFYDKNILCGFIYMATLKNLTFVMFFAVDETIRSRGYGSRILQVIQSLHPQNKMIVSIEPCEAGAKDIAQRLRRKRFYLANGYAESGYYMELAKCKQEILIKNGSFDEKEFSWFFLKYSNFTVKPKIWRKGLS